MEPTEGFKIKPISTDISNTKRDIEPEVLVYLAFFMYHVCVGSSTGICQLLQQKDKPDASTLLSLLPLLLVLYRDPKVITDTINFDNTKHPRAVHELFKRIRQDIHPTATTITFNLDCGKDTVTVALTELITTDTLLVATTRFTIPGFVYRLKLYLDDKIFPIVPSPSL